MRHCVGVLVLVVLLGASAGASQSPEERAGSRLIVQVRNATADGSTVVGDRVVVQLYRDQGQVLLDTLEGVVGETGQAVFDSLPGGSGVMAVARAEHQNMTFGGRPVALGSAGRDIITPVTVYDVSTDPSGLSIGIHHIIIGLQGASLEITEYFQLENNSDKAVLGAERDAQDKPIVIQIGLPEGFSNLQALDYFEPHALVTTPAGFYDTMAVPPGVHQVTFSYRLGIEGSSVKVDRRISLPTEELLIFWKGGDGAVLGLGEPAGQLTNADGVPMTYYERANLVKGDEIHFELSGLKATSRSDTNTWIVLGVVFAAVAVVAVLRLRSGSPQGQASS